MKKKIIYGLLLAVALVTASSSFVSCKDYEGDDYAALTEKNAALEQYLNEQIEAMRNMITACGTDCKSARDLLEARIVALEKDTASLAQRIHENALAIATAQSIAEAAKTAAANAQTTANEALERSKNDSIWIKQLHENFDKFWQIYGPTLDEAMANAQKAYITLISDSTKWNEAAATVSANKQLWTEAAEKVRDSSRYWSEAYETIKEKAEVWNNAVTTANNAWAFVSDSKYNTIGEFEKAFEDKAAELQRLIDALREDVDNILGTLKKQITGVIIQGAYSPVIGYGSLPFGVQTNILGAYAGLAAQNAEFPTADAGHYGDLTGEDDVPAITEEDYLYLDELGLWPADDKLVKFNVGDLLISDAEDNAGRLYLTVNPTSIDFQGTDFKVVNSKGEDVLVDLSPLRPSQEILHFGWTRSGIAEESLNGFYAVNAKIAKDNALNMQPNIQKGTILSAAKKVLSEHSKASVKDLAQAVFNGFQNVLQRNAIQATWYDDVKKTDVSYTSEYALAAATVQPLSYAFLKDVEVPDTRFTRLPTIDKHLLADELHITMDMPDFDALVAQKKAEMGGSWSVLVKIDQIILELNPQVLEGTIDADGTIHYTYAGYAVYNPAQTAAIWRLDENEIRQGAGYVYLDMTPLFETLFGVLGDAFASLGTLPNTVNDMLDPIIDQVNNAIDTYNRYATRANGIIESLPVRLNSMLQPVLLYQSAKGISRLSSSYLATSHIALNGQEEGEINLLPTSFSLDLLAPAYKKSLIVTNVYMKDPATGVNVSAQGVHDRNGLETQLQKINEQLKDYAVFESVGVNNPVKLVFNKEQAGMTFEIAYTAVDYAGKVAGRKFYVTVTE